MNSIVFANNKAYILNHLHHDILYNLNNFYSTSKLEQELTSENLHLLENNYLITTKYSNNNFLLFLTTINNKYYSILIDTQQEKFIYVKLRFDKDLYKGTLFSGELLLNNKNKWTFYINDMYAHEGVKIDISFSKKILLAYNILKSRYIWDEFMNIFLIAIKPHFTYEYLDKVLNTDITELLLIPEDSSKNIIKVNIKNNKLLQQNNINNNLKLLTFEYSGNPDVYKLKDKDNNDCGIAYVRTLKDSKYLNDKRKNGIFTLKCKYNKQFSKWQPLI